MKPSFLKHSNFSDRLAQSSFHSQYNYGSKSMSFDSANLNRFVCEHCNYRALSKSKLAVHMRSHSGEKPFACHLCNYRSINRGNLTYHLRTHEGMEPYKCQNCDFKSKYFKPYSDHIALCSSSTVP